MTVCENVLVAALTSSVLVCGCTGGGRDDVGSSSSTDDVASSSSTTVFVSTTELTPLSTSDGGIAVDGTGSSGGSSGVADTTHGNDSGTSGPAPDCGGGSNCGVNLEHDLQCQCDHVPVDPIDVDTCGCALLAGVCVCPDVGYVPTYVCAWPCAYDLELAQCMCGLMLDQQAPISYCL